MQVLEFPVRWSYAVAVEMEAAIRGEPYTPHFIGNGSMREEGFRFVCSDEVLTSRYKKETIARHSLLVRHFIEAFPDAEEIDVRPHGWTAVRIALSALLGNDSVILESSVLAAMQLLTPASDLFYLSLDLPISIESDFILSILRGLTDEERRNIVRAREIQNMDSSEPAKRELPNQGRGYGIVYAFPTIEAYIDEVYIAEIRDAYPSYVFLRMLCGGVSTIRDLVRFLVSSDFSDNSGELRKYDRVALINGIFDLMPYMGWEEFTTVLAMFEVKDDKLGNVCVDKMAPYQLVLHRSDKVPIEEAIRRASDESKVAEEVVTLALAEYKSRSNINYGM